MAYFAKLSAARVAIMAPSGRPDYALPETPSDYLARRQRLTAALREHDQGRLRSGTVSWRCHVAAAAAVGAIVLLCLGSPAYAGGLTALLVMFLAME